MLATTATLAAVFIPVSFMPGIVGSLFSEFGFVLAFSVSISAAVALTVCPMLASKFGTGEEGHDDNSLMGRIGNGLTNLYMGIVEACLQAALDRRRRLPRLRRRSASSPSRR